MFVQYPRAIALALGSCCFLVGLPAASLAQSSELARIEDDLRAATADPKYAAIGDPRARLQAYWRDHLRARSSQSEVRSPPREKAHAGVQLSATRTGSGAPGESAAVPLPTSDPQTSSTSPNQFRFLVRQSFADVSIVSAPSPNATATGASIGYTDDRAGKNVSWSTQAAVIGGYSMDLGSNSSLEYLSFGPYYTIDKVSNSSAKLATQNKDNETAGGLVELGFRHSSDYYDWLRGKAGVVDDNVKGTSTFSSSLEWIPVYLPYFIHRPRFVDVPWGQAAFRFDPEVVLQYDDSVSSANTLLFSNKRTSLRIGPQLGLYMLPFPDVAYLDKLLFNVTYHPWYEVYSGKNQYWVQANATYNFDTGPSSPDAVGLTFTYQNGADENTGKLTNLYKVTLTTKIDYCSASCPEQKSSNGSSN